MILTIISPVYNAGKYLKRFLDSIVVQTDVSDNTEIIMVDDGSTDNSADIINDYIGRYPYIRYIYQDNAGPAAARNRGIAEAQGRWLYFADPDDYLASDALETIMGILSEYVYCDVTADTGARTSDTKGGYDAPDVLIFDAYEHRGRRISKWEHYSKPCIFTQRQDICRIQGHVLYPYVSAADRMTQKRQELLTYSTPLAAPWDKVYNHEFLLKHELCFNEGLRVLDDMFFNTEVFGAASIVRYIKAYIYHYIHNTGTVTSGYSRERLDKDRCVWMAAKTYIKEASYDDDLYMQSGKTMLSKEDIRRLSDALNMRIIKSYAILLKLSYFHPMNKASVGDKLKQAARVLRLTEYNEAFRQADIRRLEWRLRPVLILGRRDHMAGLYILSLFNRLL